MDIPAATQEALPDFVLHGITGPFDLIQVWRIGWPIEGDMIKLLPAVRINSSCGLVTRCIILH